MANSFSFITKPYGGILKIYRSRDQKELSVNFEGAKNCNFSLTPRCDVCVFPNADSGKAEEEHYFPTSSEELVTIMWNFINGK